MAKTGCDIFNGAVKREERLLAEDKKLSKLKPTETERLLADRLVNRKAILEKLKKESVTDFSGVKGAKPKRPKSEVQLEMADVQREIREIEGSKKALKELFDKLKENKRFTAESEEKLKAYFEKLSKTDIASLRDKRLVKEAARRLADSPKGKTFSQLNAWSEGSMLSSPTTWFLALGESGIVMPLFTGLGRMGVRAKNFITGAKYASGELSFADSIFGLKVKAREFMPSVRSAYDFLSEYSFSGVHKIRKGEFDFDRINPTADNHFLDTVEEAFKDVLAEETGLSLIDRMGRWLSNQYRLPRHLIQTADKLGGRLNYVGELATEAHAWARREITSNPVYNMLTDAQKQAKIALMAEEMFKKPSIQIVEAAKERARLYALVKKPESVWGNAITKLAGKSDLARFTLPFAKTWINGVELMVKSDPVLRGLERTFEKVPYMRDFFKKLGLRSAKDIDPRRKALYQAMALGGTTIMGSAVGLHQSGRLTGDYVPGAKPAGWQPNSILINGRYYSYNRLGVVGGYMKMGVNLSQTYDEAVYYGKQGEWEKSLYSVMSGSAKHGVLMLTPHTVLSTIDFLSGVSGLNKGTGITGAMRDPDVYRMISNMGARFIPALSFQRWLNRLTDGKARETSKITVEDMSSFTDKLVRDVQKSLPYFSKKLPIRYDILGDEQGSGTPPTVLARAFGAIYPVKMQDVPDLEIDRWYRDVGFYQNPYVYSRKESIMNRTLNYPRTRYAKEGEKVDLNPTEYSYLMLASAGKTHTKLGERYGGGSFDYGNMLIDEIDLKAQLKYQIKNDWPFIKDNFTDLVSYNRELEHLAKFEGVAHQNLDMQRYAFHKMYQDYKAMGRHYLEQKYGEDLDKRLKEKSAKRKERELKLFEEGLPKEESFESMLQEGRTPLTDLAGVDPIDADEYMEDDDIAAGEELIAEASRKWALRDGYYDPTTWYTGGADMKETVLDGTGKVWDEETKMAYIEEMKQEVMG